MGDKYKSVGGMISFCLVSFFWGEKKITSKTQVENTTQYIGYSSFRYSSDFFSLCVLDKSCRVVLYLFHDHDQWYNRIQEEAVRMLDINV